MLQLGHTPNNSRIDWSYVELTICSTKGIAKEIDPAKDKEDGLVNTNRLSCVSLSLFNCYKYKSLI